MSKDELAALLQDTDGTDRDIIELAIFGFQPKKDNSNDGPTATRIGKELGLDWVAVANRAENLIKLGILRRGSYYNTYRYFAGPVPDFFSLRLQLL